MLNEIDIRTFKNFNGFKKRFLSKCPKEYLSLDKNTQTNNCIEWQGSSYTPGYGRISWDGANYTAHRISYLIHKGIIPYGKMVLHTCDNRICINPKHLILGNGTINAKDRDIRGRNKSTTLNEEAVKVIKWFMKYQYKYELNKKLACLYEVDISTINKIHRGITWKWVQV